MRFADVPNTFNIITMNSTTSLAVNAGDLKKAIEEAFNFGKNTVLSSILYTSDHCLGHRTYTDILAAVEKKETHNGIDLNTCWETATGRYHELRKLENNHRSAKAHADALKDVIDSFKITQGPWMT